jgi:glycosyltransferase involved in cell wall biosynthesis
MDDDGARVLGLFLASRGWWKPEKMMIAHVLSSFGLGGQERVALDLAKQQHAAGHNVVAVSLASPPEGPNAENFRAAGIRAETVAKGSGVDASVPLRLGALLRKERAEVVHTHNPHALIYGAPAAVLARASVIHTKHGMNPDTMRRLWLRRVASSLLDACVAVAPALAKVARRNRECDPALLHVIPNGIDLVRFAPRAEARRRVRAELAIPDDAWVVGTVGRLSPEKDQALLVRAMAPLLDRRRHLVIVGDGPEHEELRSLITGTWRSEFVHMTGARADVEQLLAAFDVFALTSRSEGLPLVLLEAMATRLPVVAAAVGGIPDVIQSGVTGFLFAAGRREDLRLELMRLFSDPMRARRVGFAGRRAVARRHSVQHMAESYAALYEEVVAGHGHTPSAAFPWAAGM